jgi:hypothetical protein
MKWIEILELRCAGRNQDTLKSEMKQLLEDVQTEGAEQRVQTFSHFTISTDFSIHLFHDTKTVPPSGGSPLGLHLASSLKRYGLVNHSIWFEMNPGCKGD